MLEIDVISGTSCIVGESPNWDASRDELLWVDILGRKILRFDAGVGTTTARSTVSFPTAIALCRDRPEAVVAFADRVGFYDLDTGRIDELCRPDPMPGNRLNDGGCDPSGRLWVGSMEMNLNDDGSANDVERSTGALFRIDTDGGVTRHSRFDIGISNTFAWSPDGKKFYSGDTLANVIYAFDYDGDAGAIRNRTAFFEGYAHGVPDGSCVDDDGCLWNARFQGGRIVRITPDGKIDREIELPVECPTSCMFGGSGRDTLFVTSARHGVSTSGPVMSEAEGCLLALNVGVRGPAGGRFGS